MGPEALVESWQRREGNGVQISSQWPHQESGKMNLAHVTEDQKAADPGKSDTFSHPILYHARSLPPFVSWRILLYKQTHDSQVQPPWLLEVLSPFFRLPCSPPSQPTCPEFSWSIQNLDSPLFPQLQSFCWRIQNWPGLLLTIEMITAA